MSQVLVYAFYLISVCTYALLPDLCTGGWSRCPPSPSGVAIKFFATLMIFLFVHQPGDYFLVPLFTAVGNLGAIVFVYWHLFRRVGIHFCRVTWREIWVELKDSSQFFLSKVAASINSNLNGILLNSLAGPAATGLYANADKVIGAAKSGMSPIADSLYPHMMKHKNFSLIKKAMLIVYPVILLGCAVVFLFAEPLLVFWLGAEGSQVVLPLRLLILWPCSLSPTMCWLPHPGGHGLAKYANIAVVFGTAVYLLGALLLWFTVGINLVTLCLLTSVTEGSILAFRLVVIVKNRKLMGASRTPQ